MQHEAVYDDVVTEVYDYPEGSGRAAWAAGIHARICIDPGLKHGEILLKRLNCYGIFTGTHMGCQ